MSDNNLDAYLYAQRFYFLAEQSLNIMKKTLAPVLREHDLNHSQHLILLVLRYADLSGRTVMSTDIAFLLGLEKHSITAVVDKLVNRGLVERERSSTDRRVIHLSLTESGRLLARTVHEKTRGPISLVPDDAQEEFARMCDFLEGLRGQIANASGQPEQSYQRAYQNLLLAGQESFRREQEGK